MVVSNEASIYTFCNMSTNNWLARNAISRLVTDRLVSMSRVAGLVFGLALGALWGGLTGHVRAQGCVQSRGAAGPCMLTHDEDMFPKPGQWQVSVGYRWLHSDREFSGIDEITGRQVGGGEENKSRSTLGDEMINDSHFIDLTATYVITKRFSASLTLPLVTSERSVPVIDHTTGNILERYSTHAEGLSDVSLRGYAWIFDPHEHPDGNLQLGVGVKFPTGDSRVKDITEIYNPGRGIIIARKLYVDQSIQPGDGGLGVILQAQGFQKIVKNTFAYLDASYLINPQEKDTATQYSIADAYLLRAGLSYAVWASKGLSLSLGGRMEGVPVTDWFGGSEGFRRPGYAISIEPGITWMYKRFAITVTAPVALERNRERSVAEIASGQHGDAAFADFVITSSVSLRF